MKITGTVKQVFPVQSGTSKNGNAWQKQEFILGYGTGEVPHSILLATMDTNVIGKLAEGQNVEVSFDFSVREWTNPQGVKKYFNEPRIWQNGLRCISQGQQSQQPVQTAPLPQAPQQAVNNGSDLPF